MEQRPLRLGDLVDDYCPRERRVTDHAVVAMIDDAIKQTRCTACDSEHPYKGGKAPRRKKAATGRLYKEVLAGIKEADTSDGHPADDLPATDDMPVVDIPVTPLSHVALDSAGTIEALATEPALASEPAIDESAIEMDTADEPLGVADEGPVHRPLIRATLPRPDGVKVERPIPDFTVRHNGNGRSYGNGNFRDARGGGKPRASGGGQQRFNRGGPAGPRQGRGGGSGFGGGRPGGGGGSRRRGR